MLKEQLNIVWCSLMTNLHDIWHYLPTQISTIFNLYLAPASEASISLPAVERNYCYCMTLFLLYCFIYIAMK